jgi:endonuclease I
MGQRIRYLSVCFAATAALLAAVTLAAADIYEAPTSYYSTATGSGGTLLTQLRAIVSDMEPVTYGEARDSAAITDADPNVSGNILLIYNRASIDGAWDPGPPLAWNREHIWPQSQLGASASNNTANIASDQFNLRPSDEDINNDRGNRPFGLDATTGNHGPVGSTYYYPGDADAGDVARAMFYMPTRWSQLSLTDGSLGSLQMGDLSSLIVYHFRDAPDAFERRRNHAIYGLAGAPGSPAISNPYRQENRNPYVDHPEWVWSVFVDQANDSQISIAGATIGGNGASTRDVDLGRVFVGAAVPGAQNFTLNKGGTDGTYFEVTASGAATSSISGRMNAFRTNMTDSKSITIGLNTTTATAGLKSGAVTINNLDITTGGGAGRGANDANDIFNVSLTVLDHATPSFDGNLAEDELVIDFGSIELGDPPPSLSFDVFNYATQAFTADLDFDSFSILGDAAAFTTDLGDFDGLLSLAAGASHTFMASLSTAGEGIFEATYTLNFSDEDIAGALASSLTLTLVGEVMASFELLAGDYNRDGVVDAVDYTVWRNTYGASVAAFEGADGNGNTMIDDADYGVWRDNYGNVAPPPGSGGLASTVVPEPTSLSLIVFGMLIAGHFRRK